MSVVYFCNNTCNSDLCSHKSIQRTDSNNYNNTVETFWTLLLIDIRKPACALQKPHCITARYLFGQCKLVDIGSIAVWHDDFFMTKGKFIFFWKRNHKSLVTSFKHRALTIVVVNHRYKCPANLICFTELMFPTKHTQVQRMCFVELELYTKVGTLKLLPIQDHKHGQRYKEQHQVHRQGGLGGSKELFSWRKGPL